MNLPLAIEQLRNVLRRQHKAIATEASYVYWLRKYVTALESMPVALPSEQKLDLPFQLARKYPEYRYSWPWAWLFPSHNTSFHPRTHLENRYRMHEANVQRAVKEARRKLGISVLPHELRHGYATHSMANGVTLGTWYKVLNESPMIRYLGLAIVPMSSLNIREGKK